MYIDVFVGHLHLDFFLDFPYVDGILCVYVCLYYRWSPQLQATSMVYLPCELWKTVSCEPIIAAGRCWKIAWLLLETEPMLETEPVTQNRSLPWTSILGGKQYTPVVPQSQGQAPTVPNSVCQSYHPSSSSQQLGGPHKNHPAKADVTGGRKRVVKRREAWAPLVHGTSYDFFGMMTRATPIPGNLHIETKNTN